MFPDLTCDDVFRLETERLWLRWPRSSDAAELATIASRAEVAEMTARIPHPYPDGEAERFIFRARADNASGRALTLALTPKRGSRLPLGLVSATAAPENAVHVGFVMAPGAWGKGYATEAVKALIEAVFALTEATAVKDVVRIENPAARRVLEKCGFLHVGQDIVNLPARGLVTCDRFRLERQAWAQRRMSRRIPGMSQQAGFGGAAEAVKP
jgi:RimJ/RimL family protein N-acetyltransferase